MTSPENELPEFVRTADGGYFKILHYGAWGSYQWVRQATLVANAYRQVKDYDKAAEWFAEYERRRKIWDWIERGKDLADIGVQFGKDALVAPFSIAADIGKVAIGIGEKVEALVFDWAPLLVIGVLVVIGIGFSKRSLQIRR